MHAYLIVGGNQDSLNSHINKIVSEHKAKALESPVVKIEDVRNLNKFTSLSLNEPTALIIKSIENATIEALNAFLKNLEEPQENLFYILTASSIHKVLPTIASRCQIVRLTVNSKQSGVNQDIDEFLKMDIGNKLIFTDKIKSREEAINFMESFIYELHKKLIETDKNQGDLADYLSLAEITLSRLKGNGNVSLQLTNLVISLV
jgi:DNA polymerase III delta prime subunit